MLIFLLQVPPPQSDAVDPFVGWVVAVLFGSLTAAISMMWRQAVAESKRKDELIDRLLRAGLENAETNRRSVSLLDDDRRRT